MKDRNGNIISVGDGVRSTLGKSAEASAYVTKITDRVVVLQWVLGRSEFPILRDQFASTYWVKVVSK